LMWPNLCTFWLLFICLYRSWSWSLPNFVWMNISWYQNYRSSLLTGFRAEKKHIFRYYAFWGSEKYISYIFHVFSEARDHILILNILFFSKLRQIIPEIRSEKRDLLNFIFILKTTVTFTLVHSAGYLILRNEFWSTQEGRVFWSPIRTFKMCIASPILVTGSVNGS
jgi:hypothetical protein